MEEPTDVPASAIGSVKGTKKGPLLALLDVMDEIERLGGYTGSGPEPVVSLELFFLGNNDEASIGCNLMPHPGISTFYDVLRTIRARPEVFDVLVGINEVMAKDEWPFADHVYVVTTATAETVTRWAAELDPDPAAERWYAGVPPLNPPAVPMGARVMTLWWD